VFTALHFVWRQRLVNRRVIARALPSLAQPRPKLSRYYVSDPYLRSWLRFIRASIPALERGRGDIVGSIKWRERGKLDRGDLSRLIKHRALVPGAADETFLVGVSRNGFGVEGLDVCLTPEDIVAAFGA
jgi:hypothetical protein